MDEQTKNQIIKNLMAAIDEEPGEFKSITIAEVTIKGQPIYKIITVSRTGSTYTDWADHDTLAIL